MNLIELAEAACIAVSYGVGRLHSRHRPPKQPVPICGCHHHLALHDPETGHCHATMSVADDWERIYNDALRRDEVKPIHFIDVSCTCRQYVGPEPVDIVFARDINFDTVRMIAEKPAANGD